MERTFTESTKFTITEMTPESWKEKMTEIRKLGLNKSSALRKEGHAFHVEILGAREIQSTESVPFVAAMMDLDWKLAARLEMVE